MEQVQIKYIATRPVNVSIDRFSEGSPLLGATPIGHKSPKNKNTISSNGHYYEILPGEAISYSRSDSWNFCFFKLECGAEFKIHTSRPLLWINEHFFQEVAQLAS